MIVEDSQRHNISSDVELPDLNDNDEKEEETQNASTQFNRNFQRPPPRYQNFRGKRRGGPYNNRGGYKRPKREDILRDKLMEDSVRNERVALLQCIRYVVTNNFFQTPKPTPTPSSDPS